MGASAAVPPLSMLCPLAGIHCPPPGESQAWLVLEAQKSLEVISLLCFVDRSWKARPGPWKLLHVLDFLTQHLLLAL